MNRKECTELTLVLADALPGDGWRFWPSRRPLLNRHTLAVVRDCAHGDVCGALIRGRLYWQVAQRGMAEQEDRHLIREGPDWVFVVLQDVLDEVHLLQASWEEEGLPFSCLAPCDRCGPPTAPDQSAPR